MTHYILHKQLLNGSWFVFIVDDVDLALSTIQTNTSTQCSGKDGVDQSFIVAVALIDRIRIPDLQDSNR